MNEFRRDFLKLAGVGLASSALIPVGARAESGHLPVTGLRSIFNVRTYGTTGNGTTVDSPAINKAIEAANAAGGGTVLVPPGTYACYSIHLKSNIVLYLEQGATIVAASVPFGGVSSGGYDPAEPNGEWEKYQEYGHNHFHNSLIWGEHISDFAIMGPGLIYGKGLSRGGKEQPLAEDPGMGNKAIALRECHNVILRDFSILQGGHFAVLVTGVDNLTIDNLKIDTNRDGMDIICCKNVRVSNCSVNSPWDDAIVPKSQSILGYQKATENLTITNCFVTGAYELGTMLDGTWKRWPADTKVPRIGRIKCGTESNCGFKNITISNCVFDGSGGLALESVDGALLEDITFTGITMRDCSNTPLFLRLGRRMRAPAGIPVGSLRRVLVSNVVSYKSFSRYGGAGLISGIPSHLIEDIKINDLYMEHRGGGTKKMAAMQPPELEKHYPEPSMFGPIPASGFFVRHARNIEFTNVEIAHLTQDDRPAFWLNDVDGIELFRVKTPVIRTAPLVEFHNVRDFRAAMSRNIADTHLDTADAKTL